MTSWVRLASVAAMLAVAAVVAVGCGGDDEDSGGEGGSGGGSINVAIVDNPQMKDIAELTPSLFTKESGIKVNYTVLDEGTLRQVTTRDVAAGGQQFDVVMIGLYEAPQFGENGSLVDLTPFASKDSAYQIDDIIPSVRTGLSVDDKLYASPFYAESSFLMYRKDLLKKAGVEMPANPTWDQVADIARKVDSSDTAGICLRGKPGWGDLGAAFTTVLNTFGGTWWSANDDGSVGEAQITQPEFKEALTFYTGLIDDVGEDDAANASFNECLAQYRDGKVAMWYDATVAAGLLEADDSPVKGKNGYAPAPVKETDASGWLWAWSLAIPASTQKQDLAWKYISFATGPDYIKQAGDEDRGRLGGDPAGHPRVDLRDPRVQEGGRRVRRPDAGGDGLGADRQPGHDAATRPAGRAVRRHPRVPGRRQPVHPAVLGGDRQADVDRRCPGGLPAGRLEGQRRVTPAS